MSYDPKNWYWLASDGRLFSSAASALVPVDDATYLAWRDSNPGWEPTPWPRDEAGGETDAALQAVLTDAGTGAFVVLADLKAALKTGVDSAAEVERGRHITAGAGQAMTYQQKAAEAARMEGDEDPHPAAYPMLAGEVGITAATLAEVGAVVRAAHAMWTVIGGQIEAARLGTKKAIDDAPDAGAARAAAAGVVWPG